MLAVPILQYFKPNLSLSAKNSYHKLKMSKKYLIKDETVISTLEMDGETNLKSVPELMESKSVQWIDKTIKDTEMAPYLVANEF